MKKLLSNFSAGTSGAGNSTRAFGQISYPVAVVEYDGMLHEVNVDRVHFFKGGGKL